MIRANYRERSGQALKNVESGRVPKRWNPGEYLKGGIRASTGKGRIRASIGNGGSGRVPEMWDVGEYQKFGIWASTGKVTSG